MLNKKEILFFIGTIGSSGYNFFVMLLILSTSADKYLEYSFFLGLTALLFPITSLCLHSLIQRDVNKGHSSLMFYLIAPFSCFLISILWGTSSYTCAIAYNILNISAIYYKSNNLAYLFAIFKNIPFIGFIIMLFLGTDLLSSYYNSFLFAIPFSIAFIIFENKYSFRFNEYLKAIIDGLKIGIGSITQGIIIFLEKKIALVLPINIAVFFNFSIDMASAIKVLKLPFFYSWEIKYFSNNINDKKNLLKKNLIITFLSSIVILIYMIIIDKDMLLLFAIFFNTFCFVELLKDYSYNLWKKQNVNYTLLMNVVYFILAIFVYTFNLKYTLFILLSRITLNLMFYIITYYMLEKRLYV